VKKALEHVEIPGEHEARERTWQLVSAAFAERTPAQRRPTPRRLVPTLAVVVLGAIAAAAFSSPGRAVFHAIRKTVGVENAQPALFALPADGRLLVTSNAGVWVVQANGSKRRLGVYASASWSPHGRYVVATRRNGLYTLTPTGEERWSLARPGVRFARWAGTDTDTRIAYLTTTRLRVVGGDGKADADAGGLPAAARIAPAWRPGAGFVVAYATTRARIYAYDAGLGADFWSARAVSAAFPQPRLLEWSSDGKRLMLVTGDKVVLFGTRSATPLEVHSEQVVDAAFRPGTHDVTVIRRPGEVSQVVLGSKVLFSTAGELRGLTWSPDGRWLLVGSPEADQWVFVRADGRKIVAVSNVSGQFRTQNLPRVEGWCCGT
jgi:hypothetical protein